MKFSNGFWLNRSGVSVFPAAEAYEIHREADRLTVLAPCSPIRQRGDSLHGPVLTVQLTSPAPDIIRVRVWHFRGGADHGPHFALADGAASPVTEENDRETVLTSGRLSVHIAKNGGWQMDFRDGSRLLTSGGDRQLAYILDEKQQPFLRGQLGLGVGECVYGLGERFTPFVKNGQTVDIWNEDGGTCSEQAYKNIPFYLTNRGYGVFVNDTGKVSFEVASEVVSCVSFSVPGEALDYFVIGGGSLKKVLANYTFLTGRPALPPAWSFGLWLSTSFTTDYDEKTVTSFVDGMARRRLPLQVFHFDCFWMREFRWCDFRWDSRVFPDPAGMLARLKAKGLHICVWINPYVAQQSPLFEEGLRGGYLLRRQDGSVWQWDMWQPGMGIVDFTNPAAREWFGGKLSALLDMGVDCFKTDFGERIPVEGVVYSDGSDPAKMHNYFTYLYNQTVFNLLEKRRGKGEAVVFARSATAGSQKFPLHWGGDCTARYVSMAETLRGGLSLGLCGFGFWSHDIGGFESTATPDLYKRWVAFGLLSSHSRLHGSQSYRVPWNFDEESVDVLRRFTQLKCRLMPYIYRLAVEAAHTGVPVLRAMVLEFENDPACAFLDRQYMLGDRLLAAPVFREDGEVEFYLPPGRWTDLFTGRKVEGGAYRRETHGYFTLPLYVRPDSLIPLGAKDSRADYDYADGVTLLLSDLGDGREASTEVFAPGGESALSAHAQRAGQEITVTVSHTAARRPWQVILLGAQTAQPLEGAAAHPVENGTWLAPPENGETLHFRL